MKNKKYIYDSNFDEMLTNYCGRMPQYVFRVKREKKTIKRKQFMRFSFVGLFVICILCAGVFAFRNINSQSTLTQNKEYGFFVKAYASEIENGNGKKIEFIKTRLSSEFATIQKSYATVPFDSKGMFVNQENPLEAGEESLSQKIMNLSFDQIAFEILSDNVQCFDVSTDNGEFIYVDLKNYDKYHNGDGTNIDKYFKKGKEIVNIPYDSENPDNSVVVWLPNDERIINGAKDEIIKNGQSENDKTIAEYKEKLLKTADDYTNYFGATINVSVKYKDEASETGKIKITFDENGYAYTSMS